MRRMALGIALLFGLLAVVAAAVAVAGDEPGAPPLTVISNAGEPFNLAAVAARERHILEVTGAVNAPRLLARRGGVAFYTANQADGARCYLTGSARGTGPAFGSVACLRPLPNVFPSEQSPVLDASSFTYDVATGESRLTSLAGFAADGVAQVGIVDEAGRLHLTRVVRNVYAASDAAGTVATAVVGLDHRGGEIYRMPLAGS